MSITITSSTDSQEAVNAAAGVTDTPPPATTEEATAQEEPEVEEQEGEAEEGDTDNEEATEEVPAEPQPRKKGGFQRKIERLTADNGYKDRRIEELEAALAGRNGHAGQQQEQSSWPRPRPVQADFATYEEYDEAKYAWRREKERREDAQQQQERTVAQQKQERQSRWDNSVGEFSAATADWEDVLQGVRHITFGTALSDAIQGSPMGARLAYELARAPKELERIAKLPPPDAVRELGKFEAKFDKPAPPKKVEVSKAPEPITPVGRGASTSTKPLDELPYQEYKRARQKQINARRRSAG